MVWAITVEAGLKKINTGELDLKEERQRSVMEFSVLL